MGKHYTRRIYLHISASPWTEDLPGKKNQLQKNQARVKIRLALMKKLSRTEWGADQNVLKKLYVGRIRPVLEYGMAASSTTAKSLTSYPECSARP